MTARADDAPGLLPFVFSGRSRGEIGERVRGLSPLPEDSELDRLAGRLADQAEPLPHRAVVLAQRGDELEEKLDGLLAGRAADGVFEGQARSAPRVAFVFSPLRSEYPGMGPDLPTSHSAFQGQMQTCAAALSPFVDWSLEEVLHGSAGTPPFARLDVSQPVLFAVETSLAELWRSVGVQPDAVVGHSIGEIAAAASCGALDLADAARVAVTWGRASMRLEGSGEMASLPLPAELVEERISRWRGRLWVAALNAPSWTAVSGEGEAIEELLEALAEEGVHGRQMGIPAPGHSPGMAAVHGWFLEGLAEIQPRAGATPFYSALAGECLDTRALDAGYWSSNLRQAVRFESAVRALARDGYDVFIEIGPRPVLTTGLEETIGDGTALGTLEQGAPASFLSSLARVYVAGVDVHWPEACEGAFLASPQGASRDEFLAGFASVPNEDRDRALLELVLREARAVLPQSPAAVVDPDLPFKDLGFGSAAAVELRNALNRATGLSLPSTLAFDYPTPRGVAGKMRLELEGVDRRPREQRQGPIDDLEVSDLIELVLEERGDR